MRLSIGSGRVASPGWTTLDADPDSGAQIVATVPPLPEFPQPLHTVEMIHSLEHLYRWDAAALLVEIYDALQPGGRLVIELPNIAFAAEVLTGIRPPIPGTAPGQCDMWPLYGDPTTRNPLYGHRWGYTPATLRGALEGAGFDPAKIVEYPAQHHVPGRDFRMEAVR